MSELLKDAVLVARKDLTIEARSRVTLSQLAPFAALILVLFAFALDNLVVRDPNTASSVGAVARSATGARSQDVAASVISAGLFWVAVVFCALLAVQRSFAIEVADGGRDGLRLSALDPGGIFLGKGFAIAVQLLGLEAVLTAGIALFFRVEFHAPLVLVLVCVLATVGLAATGTCYGAISAGLRVRDTLLPVLYFPVVAPLLLAAVKASAASLTGDVGDAWPWVRLLAVFCVVYTSLGVLVFGPLLEDS